jgi:amino acid adenylation domain-containing protein/non-ribosomal peptide synthase protein (TIGR01720 family)
MDKNEIEAIYPLSPMQQGMLFHSLYESQAGLYFEQLRCKFSAGLDVAAFQSAWQQMVNAHPVLRTQFMWENLKEPLQIVRRQASLPWIELDWQHLGEQEQREQMTAFLANDRALGLKLNQTPLMRITLIQLSPVGFECIVSFHHLILDGWSMPLLLDELLTLYSANVHQKPVELESRRPYRDYITWLQRQNKEQAATFWRAYLKVFRTPMSLASNKSGGKSLEIVSNNEATCDLSPQTIQALRLMAKRYKLTMNTIVQGAWAFLLSRYSGTEDIVFGGVVSGRPPDLVGVEQMIGLFINTLPVRIQVSNEQPIYAWLQDIQLQQIEARQYEYSSLAQVQGWSELPHGQPLFESILVFENYPVGTRSAQDDALLQIDFEQALEQTNYPFSLEVSFTEKHFSLRLVFDDRHVEDLLVNTMLIHLRSLLEQMATHTDSNVGALSLLTDEERRHMLVEWNMTQEEYPRIPVHTLFEAQVERTPHAPLLKFEGTTLTYEQVNERSNQIAHYLRTLHVGPDILVGLALERTPMMVIALLAVLKAGGAYVPLDPSSPEERLSFMINDAHIPVLLTSRNLSGKLAHTHVEHVVALDADWQLIAPHSTANPVQVVDQAHLAYMIYTSGSTGQPKGVLISHQGLSNYLHWCCRYYDVQYGSRSVIHSSLSFDLTVTSLFPSLLTGGCITLVPEDQDMTYLRDILRQGNDFSLLKITPAHLSLLNQMLDPEEMPGVARALVIGGEALQGDSLNAWRKYAPATRIINEYGPTESVVGCCIYELAQTEHIQGSVPIGHPIANTHLYILDASLQPVPVGVAGELYISGDGLARGYLNRPDLTAERFIADPFSQEPGKRMYKTGDLARYRPEGTIEFLGRLDHQVKIRGYRIELGEIEFTLKQHKAVHEAIVMNRVHTASGNNRLVAYITTESGQAASTSDLKAFLKEKLPEYMLPSAFVLMDAFPLTSNGKVERNAFPESEAAHTSHVERKPLSPIETHLTKIWSLVLGVANIGINDNFFELGGDSIQGIQIIDQARRRELRLTLKQLFQAPTIAELAMVVDVAPSLIAEQGEVTGAVPLTPIQHWFFEQNLAESNHWNQAMILEGWQSVQPELLKKALKSLLIHHDALRMRFVHDQDGWRQENVSVNEEVPFLSIDLSPYDEAEQEQRLERVEAELQASLNLEEGPLLRMALFTLGKQRPQRILIIAHHLVIDSVSWRILLEDLQTAYQQLSQGQQVQLPSKTTSFKHYAEQLVEYAQSEDLHREMPYWVTATREHPMQLPLDYPAEAGINTECSVRVISRSLDATETRLLLQEVPGAYHTQINEVLLTALIQTFEEWTGRHSLLIDMEGHGREDILENVDLSRTVGWFTSLFPVLLAMGRADGPGDVLKAVKEQLRTIPNRGIGYGLLHYLCRNETTKQLLQNRAEVSFNYLGQFEQKQTTETLFGKVREASGSTHSPHAQRLHQLDIGGAVVDGQLTIEWSFSERLHRPASIEYLAENYMAHLHALIEHCLTPNAGGYTPSDFPLAKLSAEKLDALSLLIDDLDEEEAPL